MKGKKFLIYLFVIFIVFPTRAFPYDQPAVNLGFTSFLDGAPPAGPGWYFQYYLRYYNANRLTDNNGDNLPLPGHSVNTTVNIFHLIYQFDKYFLYAQPGVEILVPWLLDAHINDGLNNRILKAQNGFGDIVLGVYLQYGPYMRDNGPYFAHRLDFVVIAPTGRYNPHYAVNPGSNFWSINPYWAATYWPTPKSSVSIRAHYLWNAKNHDPNIAFPPFITDTQAGQAIFANFAGEYQIGEKLHLGVNGYFFYQITDTKTNGQILSGRRERVWALGPGLLYKFNKESGFFFNVYDEFDARNRPQGYSLVLRPYIKFGS